MRARKAHNTMNHLIAQPEVAMASDDQLTGDTRLHGKLRIIACAACVAAGFLSLADFITSIPATYSSILLILCTGSSCTHPAPDAVQFVQQLQALGLSALSYAIYNIVLNIIFVCGYFVVAIILFWRKSNNWMAIFASFLLVTFAITFAENSEAPPAPPWNLPFKFVVFLGAASIVVFFYLFPTGRFVPRWTRWLSIGAILYWGFKDLLPPVPMNQDVSIIFMSIAFLGFVGTLILIINSEEALEETLQKRHFNYIGTSIRESAAVRMA